MTTDTMLDTMLKTAFDIAIKNGTKNKENKSGATSEKKLIKNYIIVSKDNSRAIMVSLEDINPLKKYRRTHDAFAGCIIHKISVDEKTMGHYISRGSAIKPFHYFSDLEFYQFIKDCLDKIKAYYRKAEKEYNANSHRLYKDSHRMEYMRSLLPIWFVEFATSHLGSRRKWERSYEDFMAIWRDETGSNLIESKVALDFFNERYNKHKKNELPADTFPESYVFPEKSEVKTYDNNIDPFQIYLDNWGSGGMKYKLTFDKYADRYTHTINDFSTYL